MEEWGGVEGCLSIVFLARGLHVYTHRGLSEGLMKLGVSLSGAHFFPVELIYLEVHESVWLGADNVCLGQSICL